MERQDAGWSGTCRFLVSAGFAAKVAQPASVPSVASNWPGAGWTSP